MHVISNITKSHFNMLTWIDIKLDLLQYIDCSSGCASYASLLISIWTLLLFETKNLEFICLVSMTIYVFSKHKIKCLFNVIMDISLQIHMLQLHRLAMPQSYATCLDLCHMLFTGPWIKAVYWLSPTDLKTLSFR